ncbi:Tyrosine kinase receptor Cad96Ca [Bulinus truncatus]|nr:Tyrosine kinase receptor Cad96Ca [Bulinus truncatus]
MVKTKITDILFKVSDTQNEETKTDFLAEVYLMKSIPPHRNVISIYGSCTGQDPFLMLLEFSVNGDLKKYLVQLRENKEMSKTTYSAYDNIAFQQGNSRIITAGNNEMLSLKTMLSFALQICRGLDHLAINKIVHRDVAARNILLFEHNIVKISDFGLARRVGQSDIYERTRKGLLPIRWMSPETVMFNQFSEKSDVWSFGILLWEMITLCLIPYSELDVDQVVEKIKGGELLLCPMNSPGEIQTIMFSCWRSSPTCRPTFSELCKQLEKTLEEHSDYIDLDVTDDHEYSTIT